MGKLYTISIKRTKDNLLVFDSDDGKQFDAKLIELKRKFPYICFEVEESFSSEH